MTKLFTDDPEFIFLGIGSTHSISDKKASPKKGPQVRLGYHPPERAWIKPERKKPTRRK